VSGQLRAAASLPPVPIGLEAGLALVGPLLTLIYMNLKSKHIKFLKSRKARCLYTNLYTIEHINVTDLFETFLCDVYFTKYT
jgi:hypothetical protein